MAQIPNTGNFTSSDVATEWNLGSSYSASNLLGKANLPTAYPFSASDLRGKGNYTDILLQNISWDENAETHGGTMSSMSGTAYNLIGNFIGDRGYYPGYETDFMIRMLNSARDNGSGYEGDLFEKNNSWPSHFTAHDDIVCVGYLREIGTQSNSGLTSENNHAVAAYMMVECTSGGLDFMGNPSSIPIDIRMPFQPTNQTSESEYMVFDESMTSNNIVYSFNGKFYKFYFYFWSMAEFQGVALPTTTAWYFDHSKTFNLNVKLSQI